jgi:hypothetical protein
MRFLADPWTLAFVAGSALAMGGSGFLISRGLYQRSRFQIILHSLGLLIWLTGVVLTSNYLYVIGRLEGLMVGRLESLYILSRCQCGVPTMIRSDPWNGSADGPVHPSHGYDNQH